MPAPRATPMATVFIPPALRDLTSGATTVLIDAPTVRALVEELDRKYPGVRDRLCEGAYFRPGQTVAVDDVAFTNRVAMYQEVGPDSEVHFIAAIAGGAAGASRH